MTTTAHPSERVTRNPYPPRIRRTRVVRVQDLSPDMRRIVVASDELEATLPVERLSVAAHVKIVVPDEATGELVLPTLGERGLVRPEGVDLAVRDYTIRAFDPAAQELTLDFVLHDHGPAGRWAIAARPGDALGVMGPRGYTVQSDRYARYVIGADETALPAAERWIEEGPAGAATDVVVLVEDAARERPLAGGRAPDGVRVHWLHRADGDDLADAVTAAVPADDGDTFVWVAAESEGLKPLRQHLRAIGFDRRSVELAGYWKHGAAGHHGPVGLDDAD